MVSTSAFAPFGGWAKVVAALTQLLRCLRHKSQHNEGLRRVVNHPAYRNLLLTALAGLLGLAAFEGPAFSETAP